MCSNNSNNFSWHNVYHFHDDGIHLKAKVRYQKMILKLN